MKSAFWLDYFWGKNGEYINEYINNYTRKEKWICRWWYKCSCTTSDFKWRGWSKDILGLKFSILGFFGKENRTSIFLGIQNSLKICGSVRASRPRSSANIVEPNKVQHVTPFFKVRKYGMGFFGGFVGIPGDFFRRVLIVAPIRVSPSLEIGSTPPPPPPHIWAIVMG